METIQSCSDEAEWDEAFFLWSQAVGPLWYRSSFWKVEGLPLWNRSVGGIVLLQTSEKDFPMELLRLLTVRSDWTLRWKLEEGSLSLVLYHHDVPCGRAFSARPLTEQEEAELDQTPFL